MKQTTENSRKRSGLLKAIGVGLGMALIFWETPASADTGPGDAGGWFSARTQSVLRVATDFRNDGMNILLARGGGGGGKGGGSGQCDGTGSGQGKGYGAKDGAGTGERPQDGSGYGAGSGSGSGDGSGNKGGSGGKGGKGNR